MDIEGCIWDISIALVSLDVIFTCIIFVNIMLINLAAPPAFVKQCCYVENNTYFAAFDALFMFTISYVYRQYFPV